MQVFVNFQTKSHCSMLCFLGGASATATLNDYLATATARGNDNRMLNYYIRNAQLENRSTDSSPKILMPCLKEFICNCIHRCIQKPNSRARITVRLTSLWQKILLLVYLAFSITWVCASPKAIDLMGGSLLAAHEPNYCNRSGIATTAGLLRSPLGQFLGFPCSNEFFHCRWQSDGYRTYKKNCRPGLVYDTLGTQNCNYDYNVKGCAISSDPARCKEKEFVCPLSESCVSLAQRCDGKYDCVLEEDEQNCPLCKPSEFPCVISEQCIPMSGRCNGVQECQDGTDEQDCDGCGQNKFLCRKSGKCISAKLRCDGTAQCPNGEDEMLCKKTGVGAPYLRMFVCENRRAQVPRHTVCDGVANCPDASDEKYCNVEEVSSTVSYNKALRKKDDKNEEGSGFEEGCEGKDKNALAISYDIVNDTVLAINDAEFTTIATDIDPTFHGQNAEAEIRSQPNVVGGTVGTAAEAAKNANEALDNANNNQSVAYSSQGVAEETQKNYGQGDDVSLKQDDRVQGDFEPLNADPASQVTIGKHSDNGTGDDAARYSSLKSSQNASFEVLKAPGPGVLLVDLPAGVPNPPSESNSALSKPTQNSGAGNVDPNNAERNQFKSPEILSYTASDSAERNRSETEIGIESLTTTMSTISGEMNEGTGTNSRVPAIQWKADPLANPWQTDDITTTSGPIETSNLDTTMTYGTIMEQTTEATQTNNTEQIENLKKPKRKVDESDINWHSRYNSSTSRTRQECRRGDAVDECLVSQSSERPHSTEAVEREILRRFTTKYGRKARDILQKIETILMTKNDTSDIAALITTTPSDPSRPAEYVDQGPSVGSESSTAGPKILTRSTKKFRHISSGRRVAVPPRHPIPLSWVASPSSRLKIASPLPPLQAP